MFIALLVFHRKDLCEARVKPEMSSYFQMKCTAQVYPLWVTSSGQTWNDFIFSDEVFKQWDLLPKSRALSDNIYKSRVTLRLCVQRRMSSYFQMKCSCSGQEQSHFQVYQQSHLQVYPQQVTSGGQEQNYFQIKCTAQVYPKFSDEVFMQWSRAGHLQMMCTGAESPSNLPAGLPSSLSPSLIWYLPAV